MPAYIKNTGGTWSNSISAFYIKSTTWRTVSAGYIKVAGTWASFFTSVLTPSIQSTVTISRNNAEYPSTLTGTNFYWTNSTSLTYVFQKSSDDVNFTNIGSAASIANPSSGSSNTVTYALTLPDFPAFTSYYRFVVTAVNSTYSTSATSTSTSVSVSRPAPINTVAPTISPSSGTVGVTEYSVTSNGTWDPVDADGVYQYLWQSYDTPSYISAPGTNTLSTYTPPSNFLSLGYQSPIRCRVTAVNASGSTAAFSSNTATVIGVALTPTFGANTSTATGFTGSVTNYDSAYTWNTPSNGSFTLTNGTWTWGVASGATRPFTVTGLSASQSSEATVTTTRTGYNSGSASTTGTASAAVVSVPSGGTVSLSPSGSQYEGVTLTASTTGWSGSPSSYSVRIYASISNPPTTSGVLKATSISGASSVTYLISQSDAAAPAYYFAAFATATNSGGTSSEEPGSNVVLSVAKTVPGLVTSFTSTSSLSGSNLNWSASWSAPSSDGGASITGYKVYVQRSSSSSGPWTATATQIPAGSGAYTAASPYSTSSQSVTGRVTSTSSTWIRVWVAAVNSVGTGTYTSAVG